MEIYTMFTDWKIQYYWEVNSTQMNIRVCVCRYVCVCVYVYIPPQKKYI